MLNCPYCDREFQRGAGLGNHIKSAHPGKPFKHGAGSVSSGEEMKEGDGRSLVSDCQCAYCDEVIHGKPSDYAQHIRLKHQDKVKPKKQKDLNGATVAFCPRCGCNIAGVATALVVAERLAR